MPELRDAARRPTRQVPLRWRRAARAYIARAIRQNAAVEIVEGGDHLAQHEGVGALLRYRETNAFDASSARIYAVAEAQKIDAGTSMFARWSRHGQPFEDSEPVKANREYQNTFVEFHLEPVSGNFDPGQYTVQIFVNGNPDKQANFTVQ
jgi:hypothetical protein